MSLSSRSPGFRMFLQHTAADAWTCRTNTGMTATSKQVVRVLRGVHMPCSTRLRIPARTCAEKRMLSTAVGAQLISSARCLCRANGSGRDRFGCGVLHRERPPGKGTIRSLPSTAWQARRHGVQEGSGQSASSWRGHDALIAGARDSLHRLSQGKESVLGAHANRPGRGYGREGNRWNSVAGAVRKSTGHAHRPSAQAAGARGRWGRCKCSAVLSVHEVELLGDSAVAAARRAVATAAGATYRAHNSRKIRARILHGSDVRRKKLAQCRCLVIGGQRGERRVCFRIERRWRELHA